MQTTSFYLGRFLKKLADDQYSSITKGSIYNIKDMYIPPFTTVDWPEIWSLMDVSTMFYIFRYCVFTWYGRDCEEDIMGCLGITCKMYDSVVFVSNMEGLLSHKRYLALFHGILNCIPNVYHTCWQDGPTTNERSTFFL